jgi:hypothetical protein
MESLSSGFVLKLSGYVEEHNPDKSKDEWVLDCSVLEDKCIYKTLVKLQNVIVLLLNTDLPDLEDEMGLQDAEYLTLLLVKMKIYFLDLLGADCDLIILRQKLADRVYIGMLQEYERQTPDRFKDLPFEVRVSILENNIVAEDLLEDTSDFLYKVLPEFNG